MWLEAKRMVKNSRVPEIMTDDWLCRGHTKLNMFSVLIKSLISKQGKLNFWNQLHQKIAFLCRLLTPTATGQPKHTIFTSSVTAILKAITDTVLLGPGLGMTRVFTCIWGFVQQERVLWGWLAGPSHTRVNLGRNVSN